MLNLYTKSSTKIISIILVQVFLCVGFLYPADALRVPIGLEASRTAQALKQNTVRADIEERAEKLFRASQVIQDAPVFENLPLGIDPQEGRHNILNLIKWIRENRSRIGEGKYKGSYSYSFILHALWKGSKIPQDKREEWDFIISAAEFYDTHPFLKSAPFFSNVFDAIDWIRKNGLKIGNQDHGYMITALWTDSEHRKVPLKSLKNWQFYGGAAKLFDTIPILHDSKEFTTFEDAIKWLMDHRVYLGHRSFSYLMQSLATGNRIPRGKCEAWQARAGAADYALKHRKAIVHELIRTWINLDQTTRQKILGDPLKVRKSMNKNVLGGGRRYADQTMELAMQFYGKQVLTIRKKNDARILMAIHERIPYKIFDASSLSYKTIANDTQLNVKTVRKFLKKNPELVEYFLTQEEVNIITAITKRIRDNNLPPLTKTHIVQDLSKDSSYISQLINNNPRLKELYEASYLTEQEAKIIRTIRENPGRKWTRTSIIKLSGIDPSYFYNALRKNKLSQRAVVAINAALGTSLDTLREKPNIRIANIERVITERLHNKEILRITKRDIAAELGVDFSSVAKVINGDEQLKDFYAASRLTNSEVKILR